MEKGLDCDVHVFKYRQLLQSQIVSTVSIRKFLIYANFLVMQKIQFSMGNQPSTKKSTQKTKQKGSFDEDEGDVIPQRLSPRMPSPPPIQQTILQQMQVQQVPPPLPFQNEYDEKIALELEEKVDDTMAKEHQAEKTTVDLDALMFEQLGSLQFQLLPRFEKIMKLDQAYNMPVILAISSLRKQQKNTHSAIDLVCVVDVSGSMDGKKIKLVKDSLRFIQKILSPQDRISIVTFATASTINLFWIRNTPDNKPKIKQSILSMKIRDSTNIAQGVEKGLWMIKNRKYKNPVTCMFVLSDGCDDNPGADLRCKQLIDAYNIEDAYVINTFGYGKDHDPKMMNQISNYKGGTFTFIDKIEKASEHFILAMSGMLSVFANKVTVQIKPSPPFNIVKIYGEDFLWKNIGENTYQMDINYLLTGQKKEYSLELEVPPNLAIAKHITLQANLSGQLIEPAHQFSKEEVLELEVTQEQILNQELKPIVEINYLRAKVGEAIGQANKLGNQRKFPEAQEILDRIVGEIKECKFKEDPILEVLMKDLQQVKDTCKPQVFEKEGQALMLNKQKNHIQRQKSINNLLEWDEQEEEQMQNFQKGDLALSVNLDHNYQEDAFDDEVQLNNSFNINLNNSGLALEPLDDSGMQIESEEQQ